MAQILDVNPEFVASPCQNDSSLGARDIEERTKVAWSDFVNPSRLGSSIIFA